MDLTNARSMELFRSLGLADKLREQGPSRIRFAFDRELTFQAYHLIYHTRFAFQQV